MFVIKSKLFFIKQDQNRRVPDTFLTNGYINVKKFMKMKSKHRTDKKHSKSRKTKDQFSKRIGQNADLSKPVLNKILTTHEQFVYYNFEATLKALKSFTLNNNKMKTNMAIITIFG